MSAPRGEVLRTIGASAAVIVRRHSPVKPFEIDVSELGLLNPEVAKREREWAACLRLLNAKSRRD